MNKFFVNLNIYLLCFFLCISSIVCYGSKNEVKVFASSSSSEIVMEVNTNRVLKSVNCYEKKYMASTTKILTAITVIENCNVEDIVTVTKKTVGIEGSSIYLEEGEKLSVKDLLYGLMLRSGNDCAETLAVYTSGSIDEFCRLMNNIAKRIGAINSNFVNPHGLHDDNHYTTAYDLALISCYALKNPIFKEICSTKKITIPFTTRNTKRLLINKNKMLNEYDGATGIKTGYTKKAGRCLVSSAEKDGLELVSVVLNVGPMFEKSKMLLDNAFENYTNYKLVDSNNIIDFIEDENSKDKIALIIKEDIILPLTKKEKESVKIVYYYPKKFSSINEFDENIGKIKIYLQNDLIFEQKIYSII